MFTLVNTWDLWGSEWKVSSWTWCLDSWKNKCKDVNNTGINSDGSLSQWTSQTPSLDTCSQYAVVIRVSLFFSKEHCGEKVYVPHHAANGLCDCWLATCWPLTSWELEIVCHFHEEDIAAECTQKSPTEAVCCSQKWSAGKPWVLPLMWMLLKTLVYIP